MKKMDSGTTAGSASITPHLKIQSPTSGDSNNNIDSSEKSKSENSEPKSSRKAFYKLIFKSSGSNNNSSTNDSNNNSQQSSVPATNNSYTKVSMERTSTNHLESKISQISIEQRQLQQQGNSLPSDPMRRVNSSNDEYELDEDEDVRARQQRALEIQQGIEIDQISTNDLMDCPPQATMLMTRDDRQECHCQLMQKQQMQRCDDDPSQRIHSQVAFRHYLVPDLEKITACCYYWGKMDRYEAEKLLEGKPEGTFLLRDSAQDEYLFSVSFRKYGRSLHARIEHFNHRFSFDSHDPSVFMAPTVTGLLEHYKDPTSVMFFEPMLTSPLHRNHVFSLQQLCRAAIVSHTTYDGINELCLPSQMKNYLKEYHYKLRVRVKQLDGTGCMPA